VALVLDIRKRLGCKHIHCCLLRAVSKPCFPCNLCRSKEVAYAPAIVARVLQPELTAAQKAVLRRASRINSISRYEAGDSRAR
jgi:hypothetical protein